MIKVTAVPQSSKHSPRPPLWEERITPTQVRQLNLPRYFPPHARNRPGGSHPTNNRTSADRQPTSRQPGITPTRQPSAPNFFGAQPRRSSLPASQPVLPTPSPSISQPPAQPSVLPPVSTPPPVASPSPSVQNSLLTLKELLAANPDLPVQTAVLGICDDQLPMLLDLDDPTPGAVLVIGDERPQQLNLLRTAVNSLALRNSPRAAQFIVFSHLPGTWRSWMTEQGYERYCLAVIGGDDPQAADWMARLADWIEQRKAGHSGPPILMIMDTLNFYTKMSAELRPVFEKLLHEGANAHIWPIATISTALAASLGLQVDHFQTFLFGFTPNPAFYEKFASLSPADAATFGVPGQFAVRVPSETGDGWLRFRLPKIV